MGSALTPMMRQYLDIKQQHTDSILFFRLGDFYEMFFDDAVEATRILHITLTSRGKDKDKKVPMCGIPYHAADNYIARLIKHGKKVAICDQMEAPVAGKSIVRREVTRIVTPGTVTADTLLEGAVNNYILSLSVSGAKFGIAYADISTGEFCVMEFDNKEDLFAELYKISPSECLVSESFHKNKDFHEFNKANLGVLTVNDDWMFDHELSLKEIKHHFAVESLEGFGCSELNAAVEAAGALLKYLKNTQKNRLGNIDVISTRRADHFMAMDRNSHRHLELIRNQEDLSARGTLFEVLDGTKTPMGKRKLKEWILNPLTSVDEIKNRLDVVQYFYDNTSCRRKVRELLNDMYDIERLSGRVNMGMANARDMTALGASLKNVGRMRTGFSGKIPPGLQDIITELDDFSDVIKWMDDCLVASPPVGLHEGGLIKEGYSPEIDELRRLVNGGKDWVADLQKSEIKRTGINSLKVGFNSVFGYYIEVTRANLDAVPSDYVRKQTLVNAERFITQALKEQESKIIGASERARVMEYEAFSCLRDKVGAEIERLKKTARRVAETDVLSNLAESAVVNRYCRPEMNTGSGISVVDGRHPVLEKILKDKAFVPNDVSMNDEDKRVFIITGSNMAGKSTFIRQMALIIIMAQMGSFVPASSADIGIVDRIFTRVGASDRLYHGMSTFMVEMLETANILNNATGKSLIILDEIGRGTSTFDGVAIAWATVEFIHGHLPGAKALFATHYHELTELADVMRGVKNYHLAIKEWCDEIIFLYKVTEGSCDESFGIHVARLAGMPGAVITRAREILDNLQKDSTTGNIRLRFSKKKKTQNDQLNFFNAEQKEHPIIDKIKNLNPDSLTPLEALKKLAELKKEVGNGD